MSTFPGSDIGFIESSLRGGLLNTSVTEVSWHMTETASRNNSLWYTFAVLRSICLIPVCPVLRQNANSSIIKDNSHSGDSAFAQWSPVALFWAI